jgi:phage/plasmid-associated DNA primase
MGECFITSSIQKYAYSNECWYVYQPNNTLKKLTKQTPDKLRNEVSDVLQRELKELIDRLPHNDEKYQERMKLVPSCHKAFGNTNFVDGVLVFIRPEYTDDDLYDLIDSNINLLAFTNGVMDLSIKKFRSIEKEDYIMKTTKYAFNEESNPAIRKKIQDFFMDLFNTKEMADYVFATIAMACFRNDFHSFYCHTGNGGNGKSVLFEFVHQTVGEYYYSAPNEFLTTYFSADRPNSVLANAKGIRIFVCSEPSTEDSLGRPTKLCVNMIKALTGGDPINVRDLNCSNKRAYMFLGSLFMLFNLCPDLNADGGLRRRLVKNDYPNKFVDEPSKPNEKKRDYSLSATFQKEEYRNEFALMIWETAKNFTGFVQPMSVVKSSEKLMNDSDIVSQWLSNNIEILEKLPKKADEHLRITKGDAYKAFLAKCDLQKKDMSATKFHKQMEANGVVVNKVGGYEYYVMKWKEIEEEEEEEQKKEEPIALQVLVPASAPKLKNEIIIPKLNKMPIYEMKLGNI